MLVAEFCIATSSLSTHGLLKVRVVQLEDGTSAICVDNPRDSTQTFKFPFTSCHGKSSSQDEIFDEDVRPLIDNVYSGVTVTIFAYGVTSSGKTHTMQGTPSDPGIIPRAVEAVFLKRSSSDGCKVAIEVSYMEIYKDEVYDLLVNRDTAVKLPVRENDAGQVFVANLTSSSIETVGDFERIYSQATKRRSVGATNLNRASSRSHAILTLAVTAVDLNKGITLSGKLNLVDLAGSENNKLTGNDSSRMAESSAINKSLSVLGQVVHALNQGASRVPYRNSKLTRILQDALGGSSIGLLICNLAPGVRFRQDTLNTLNFAVRTKNIENKPVVNQQVIAPIAKARISLPRSSNIARITAKTMAPRTTTSGTTPRSLRPSLAGPSHSRAVESHDQVANSRSRSGDSLGLCLTEDDINERITKAVEREVARRLQEQEQQRKEEALIQLAKLESHTELKTLPPGTLTPLLKRHHDLDEQLKQRLEELDHKLDRANKETHTADILSPVSRKRTGRAYVALARAHSEKNNMQLALELYRKAESYVPDNVKLKERIIEIEWAVKNNQSFNPSPKRPKKAHRKKSRSAKSRGDIALTEWSSGREHVSSARKPGGSGDKENFDVEQEAQDERFGKKLSSCWIPFSSLCVGRLCM
ncbi:Kinesin-like protein KIF22 [Grifola frondosa]|uniref:Kinesin-like protein n=1 Tax=Grifola frondosa TaxID=5627 RepID=A0A1C7LTK9_GRIFR|nr:Kinesin-like protein KIF22 [Grifola frondosa]